MQLEIGAVFIIHHCLAKERGMNVNIHYLHSFEGIVRKKEIVHNDRGMRMSMRHRAS